jgi:flagellar basal-body rod protein FlgF/flagellar basal-body rod protein FlgG
MNSGYYAACAGLRAQTQALEVVASNLANLSTSGYRGQQPVFRSLLAGATALGNDPLSRAINDFNVMGDARVDRSAGNLQPTGNPLDLAIEGGGFFVVQTKNGIRYTRDGNFQVSAQGLLTTGTGDPVLGVQGPINVPSGPLSISADGTLSINGAVSDQIRMVEFPTTTSLLPEGTSYYAASSAPSPATTSYIRQGMLESSNVNAVLATASLISVQRRFDMLEGAMSAYYNTFNRIAAQDLPRV